VGAGCIEHCCIIFERGTQRWRGFNSIVFRVDLEDEVMERVFVDSVYGCAPSSAMLMEKEAASTRSSGAAPN